MSRIDFYTNPMSRGQIARWALHEAGADYEQHIVGYGDEMKSDTYLAINPMGKVPAIVHDGRIVTECAAICAYLADAFLDAGLAPTDDERADYYRWLFFAAGPVEAAITNKSKGIDPEGMDRARFGYGHYDLVVETLADWLADHDYVCGGRFTAADVYVGSQVVWGVQFETLPRRDEFVAYSDRLTARDAYREAKAIDAQLIAEAEANA